MIFVLLSIFWVCLFCNDSLSFSVELIFITEYNRTASIQFTEISNRRLRQTPSSLLKIGKQDVMQVLRVDEEKGYIDLTKKNVDGNFFFIGSDY